MQLTEKLKIKDLEKIAKVLPSIIIEGLKLLVFPQLKNNTCICKFGAVCFGLVLLFRLCFSFRLRFKKV
jgi:hypothetical protein